ncbi:MAG: glycoside hydrolase family 2 [Segetibacter sp.]|nr:glycoside hydrolase family 2 [Segetibacter sp.]
MKKRIFAYSLKSLGCLLRALPVAVLITVSSLSAIAQQTIFYNLSGTDKDHTVQWDFFCTKGQNSGKWTKIAVPSNWELQGFGGYTYGNGYNIPKEGRSNEQGIYKYAFTASRQWKNKRVFIVFEGVMTDAEVKINGQFAGPVHQGGLYQFRYDITNLINYTDSNRLEVTVSKQSSNKSVNRAEREGDFWALAGIFRPVYLEIVPETFISKVAIDAKANGAFKLIASIGNGKKGDKLEVQIKEINGTNVGKPFTTDASLTAVTIQNQFQQIKTWNPERPHLYQVVLSLKRNGKVLHTMKQRFGFRTAELRPGDGFYVNDVKVIFKGVDRHSAWPETGRTLSKEISIMDVKLMKEMNMNAVRMSHYPPDQHFLDVCDSLGLFVLDELTGWQAAYDTIVGRKLVKELVERDVNHPSIVMWANGNERGWNEALDNDFKLYDPQNRLVYHPQERFNGTDTKHYPDYNYVVNSTLYGNEVFFPTEFMHGLYDGGHGAGLQDFWELMIKHPYAAGGFLWDFADEGMVRTDKGGSIDTDGNHGADGILGPHREKEASYYAIKEIWSPVQITMKNVPANFDGKINVENRYLYTNLNQCSFKWKLVSFPLPAQPTSQFNTNATGNCAPISLAAGEKGYLKMKLPANWKSSDALYLTAYDQNKQEIFTWSWNISSAAQVTKKALVKKGNAGAINAKDEGEQLIINNGNVSCYFTKSTGFLDKVISNNSTISLSGGPVMAASQLPLKGLTHYANDSNYVVEVSYGGEGSLSLKWIFSPGKPAKLEYVFQQKGDVDFIGLSMNYPEEKITGMRWLGRGPYRVWKNRMQGLQLGVWHKDYNNTVTGESWLYPEFKGYHANVNWVVVETKEKPFTIYCENENMFFQMLKPEKPKGATNDNNHPPFPAGNLGIMHAIPPIGTKFQAAEKMGPQSQKNMQLNYTPVLGAIWFEF